MIITQPQQNDLDVWRHVLKDDLDLWLTEKRQELMHEARLTPDKLFEWWWKRIAYQDWVRTGSPILDTTNHPGVMIEAHYAGKIPVDLINEWGANDGAFEQIMIATMAFRAQQRALIAVADESGLIALGDWATAYEAFLTDYALKPWDK